MAEEPIFFDSSKIAFWNTEKCYEELQRSLVTRSCLENWASLVPFPVDDAKWSVAMKSVRKFYLNLLRRGNPDTFHTSWTKVCCLFDVAMHALLEAKSPLLDDLVTIATSVMGISRKDETSSASACLQDLLLVAEMCEEELGLPHKARTARDMTKAEITIFEALDWTLPQTDTYQCISVIMLRADILTKGEDKALLEMAWQRAVAECLRNVLNGDARGYTQAHSLVRKALSEVGYDLYSLDLLLGEAAPFPS